MRRHRVLDAVPNLHLHRRLRGAIRSWCGVRAQLHSVGQELESARGENVALRAQLHSVGQELESARGEHDPLRAQLHSVGLELESARGENDPLRAQLHSVGVELAVQRRRNVMLEAAIDSDRRFEMRPPASSAGRSILFNALPKSGSSYCFEMLRRRMGLAEASISLGYFPIDMVALNRLKIFAWGGQIAHHHLDASDANLILLRQHPPIIIVHLRDPRQALVSWIHHLMGAGARETPLQTIEPVPASWFGLALPDQIDWMIDHHFCLFVRWIEDWARAIDQGTITARFTTYEEMRAGEQEFFAEIARHCGLDDSRFEEPLPDPRSDSLFLFRSGQIDEWRRVFSPAQIARVNSLLPQALSERFRWPVT